MQCGWRVVGELLLLDGGTFYADVFEEHAGSDDGLGDDSEGVRDEGVVANCDDAGAEAAVVEFIENRSANKLTGAVEVDAVEQPRVEFASEGFDLIDVLVLLFCHRAQPLVEFLLGEWLVGLDEDDARARVGSLRGSGTSVAVGG